MSRNSASILGVLLASGVLPFAGTAGGAPLAALARPATTSPSRLADIASLMVAAPPEARLPAEHGLDLMRRFVEPWVERPGEWNRFWSGHYGPSAWLGEDRLAWSVTAQTPEATEREQLAMTDSGVSFELAPVPLRGPRIVGIDLVPIWSLEVGPASHPALVDAATAPRCKPWEHPYSVTLARYGGEHDSFRLLDCDGSVALDALDRLSVIARPPEAAQPALPLPLEPDPTSSEQGEWVPGVRLLDPRLLWVLARISEAYPYRPIYVISGYRRDGHGSFHRKGRALDLFVMGVSNESVFKICRKLKDVGCGYYPNNKFVHVDVRAPNTGHALWIDVSGPGEPSHYVDAWPGVVEGGALAWQGAD